MVIEPVGINILGAMVGPEDFNAIHDSLREAYRFLERQDRRWDDNIFCRIEIFALWDSILATIERNASNEAVNLQLTKDKIMYLLDDQNRLFLEAFGRELERRKALAGFLAHLRDVSIEPGGSFTASFLDNFHKRRVQATIVPEKILQIIKKGSEEAKASLAQFVEWAKENKSALVTGALAGAAVTIAVFALVFGGLAVLVAGKAIIITSVTVLCAIESIVTGGQSIAEVLEKLRKVGISLRFSDS